MSSLFPLQLASPFKDAPEKHMEELVKITNFSICSDELAIIVNALNESTLWQETIKESFDYCDKQRDLERTFDVLLNSLRKLSQIRKTLPQGEVDRLDCIAFVGLSAEDRQKLGGIPLTNFLEHAGALIKPIEAAQDTPRTKTGGDQTYMDAIGIISEAYLSVFKRGHSSAETSTFFKLINFWFQFCLGLETDASVVKNGKAKPKVINVRSQILKFKELE